MVSANRSLFSSSGALPAFLSTILGPICKMQDSYQISRVKEQHAYRVEFASSLLQLGGLLSLSLSFPFSFSSSPGVGVAAAGGNE